MTYDFGKSTGNHFEHNVFFGNHVNLPKGVRANEKRPPLTWPGGGGSGRTSLDAYRPKRLPDFMLGVFVPGNGGQDIFGHALPVTAPTVGAIEAQP